MIPSLKLEKTNGKGGLTRAPLQQAMRHGAGGEADEAAALLASASERLAAKEASLQALSDALDAEEAALAASQAADAPDRGVVAERWRSLSGRRSELVVRWQCLLEERRQLGGALAPRRPVGGEFEPGAAPMRDVTCALVTHQMDVPCLSCCFQR